MTKQKYISVGKWLLIGLLLITGLIATRLGLAYAEVAHTPILLPPQVVDPLGETDTFTLLPLYEEASADERFVAGHGVSYLIRTDDSQILLDLGGNPDNLAQPPVLQNLQAAGLDGLAFDWLVISHPHPDHVGGLWGPEFLDPEGQPLLNVRQILAPQPRTLLGQAAQVAAGPQILAPGVATLGSMPFVQPFPFWLWQPLAHEQGLVVNVSGHGLVLISGCAHPTPANLIARAEGLFQQPVVGVVGGLHLEGLSAAELVPTMQLIAARDPQLVALSPHDNGAMALEAFELGFFEVVQPLEVGAEIGWPSQ